MEYRHLRFFVAVAEELSFTRAAERLHVAQPHLSREIRALEEKLDVPLFVRDRRKVALSTAGQAFLEQTYRILAETEEAVRTARRAHRGLIGRIRIGFASSAGFGLLPDAVRRFREGWPDVELELTELNSDEQPDMVRRNVLDVALLYPPRRPRERLVEETLAIDPLVVGLPAGHPLSARQTIPLGALASEPWVLFPRPIASRLHDEIIHACRDAGFTPRIAQEARKLSTILSLVAGGLGTSLVPDTLMSLRPTRIAFRPVEKHGPTVPLTLMWREGDDSAALASFLEVVRAVASGRAAGTAPPPAR